MPSVVVKPDPDRDQYVVWSDNTESPHAYGTRAEVAQMLRDGLRSAEDDVDGAMWRADQFGSSAMPEWGDGHWGDDTWIYKQAGVLRRRDLWQAAAWQCEGKVRDILDLLDPFEDDDGAEHLRQCKRDARDEPPSGGRVAWSEVALARKALAHVKRTIEGCSGS